MVHYTRFPSALGECGIAWRGDLVVATRLPDARPADTDARLAARTGGTPGAPPASIQQVIAAITALLEGQRTDLSCVACDLASVEPFAAQVYTATRAVPAGETTTYGAIARALGNVQFARRVGTALGRNPLPLIIPCHRVVGAHGALTGFSATGGVALKRRLLAIEGAPVGGVLDLFDG